MPIRVLVVDDSGFFRRRVKAMLEADSRIEVIGEAINGEEAVSMASRMKPDAITMDIEMPIMDGITATRRIMQRSPCAILMFSSLTTDGAKATLDALDAGAADYLPKRLEDISNNREEVGRILCERVVTIGKQRQRISQPPSSTPPTPKLARPLIRPAGAPAPAVDVAAATAKVKMPARGSLKLVAIGTSTGGPVALQEVLTKLPGDFPYPVLLVQHMPGTFTPAFSQRLNQMCAINVKEAADGDELQPGLALLAPGGKQMLLEAYAGRGRVRIIDAEPAQIYKPCVDTTFSSVADIYPSQTLAIILTGMGADGREGCRALKNGGSIIWSQDAPSCVVYGMPAAVADAGLSDGVLALQEVGPTLAKV